MKKITTLFLAIPMLAMSQYNIEEPVRFIQVNDDYSNDSYTISIWKISENTVNVNRFDDNIYQTNWQTTVQSTFEFDRRMKEDLNVGVQQRQTDLFFRPTPNVDRFEELRPLPTTNTWGENINYQPTITVITW